ncbi:lysine-specific demethylase 4B isoform X2 [Cajanus cajan]|uniref:lysine-specific demethylase 4B isoform X2 n=1 Tax=Cajanus cajan TaxID=3821 RepID=UPI0010FB486A|nr:lysine-specific demethylase 4B isoform X2 [Cajanus cajan]
MNETQNDRRFTPASFSPLKIFLPNFLPPTFPLFPLSVQLNLTRSNPNSKPKPNLKPQTSLPLRDSSAPNPNPEMGSTTSLNDLPPLKRLRLMQQQEHDFESSPLPTKKRKESRTQSTPSPTRTFYNHSLPAKKRVWAPQPQAPPPNDAVPAFDLNADPSPDSDSDSDDGVLCCVCQSTDGDPADPIVFCDGCDLMVHASCYGNPLARSIPDGDWFCERCRFGGSRDDVVRCELCPAREGAVKRCTREGAWAHVVCALFVPEVFFRDPEGREGIDCSMVPERRWAQRCYVCGLCDGCGLVCSEPKCGLGFHVTCALKEELWMEYREGKKGDTVVAGFCKTHTRMWEKQSGKYKIVAVEDEK